MVTVTNASSNAVPSTARHTDLSMQCSSCGRLVDKYLDLHFCFQSHTEAETCFALCPACAAKLSDSLLKALAESEGLV